MKKIYIILLSLLMISSLACNDIAVDPSPEENLEAQTIKICFPGGGPALSIAKLVIEDPIFDENIDIEYEFLNTPDLLVSKILKEEADIAIVPSNLAAQAYNKGLPYRLAGTSTWGTLHLISTDDIESLDDLKGREIYSFGKDLTPDLVARYILIQNGIDLESDLSITYLSAASEVGPAFLGNKTNLAIFSEPVSTNVLMKDTDAKIVLDFNQEWSNITGIGHGYPQASLIIKADLIENNIDFLDSFIKAYGESQVWAKNNPQKLGAYVEDMEIGMKKEMVINGIERMNIGPLNIDEDSQAYQAYYKMLLEYAPQVIGGKIPDEGFYYKR